MASQNLTSAWKYWANLTYLVGQSPSLDKYKYQILTWANKGGQSIPTNGSVSKGRVTIDDHYGHKHRIQQISNNLSIRRLG